jgi:hypothetical protein
MTGMLIGLASLAAFGQAQQPDGKDIPTAIPYYFGQVATGIGDPSTSPRVVYSVNLAKGQTVTVSITNTSGSGHFGWALYKPSALSAGSATGNDTALNSGCCDAGSKSDSYLVPVSGTYYISIVFTSTYGYQLIAKAQGPASAIPNPTTAGCLTGTIDYITYSLQLIAANLPDEASIGGTKMCATCTVKPPAYSEIVHKMEYAMGSNLGVSACYDTTGNIFQVKVTHP